MKNGVYFVSGIDTNIGKSFATGFLAKKWNASGYRTITQKMIQTGNQGESEDIVLHRKIMGIDSTPEDLSGLTAPIILSYPASPHLAAEIDKTEIDTSRITRATKELQKKYDIVLLEGAGGLMVPISMKKLTIDYVAETGYPVILVTSGRLGSINHTLLSLEALYTRKIALHSIVYNLSPEADVIITQDTIRVIQHYLKRFFPSTQFEILEHISL